MTEARFFIDNAPQATLPIGIDNSQVTFTVSSLVGFPTNYPYFATVDLNETSAEVVKVTGASGTTVTVIRDANSLGSFSHPASSTFTHTAVALDLQDANDHVNATANVHGITSDFVGTDDPQTLTQKTLDAPIIVNGSAVTGDVSVDGDLSTTGDFSVTGSVTYGDDTGWHDLVLLTGWAVAGGTVAQCRRKDGVVYFRGQVSNATFVGGTGAPVTFATMPVDGSSVPFVPYPPYAVEVAATGNTPFVRTVSVLADGTVRMFAEAASSTAFGLAAISYLTD